MRVITGAARGRRLITPEGLSVRPTTDAVKESVFSIIQFSIEGRRFLDAFAGSGQMGIEALSRGAKYACFVDNSRESVSVIKKNLALTGLSERAGVFMSDTLSFMKNTGEAFDTVFLDPPYSKGLLQQALTLAAGITNRGGYIICEHPADEFMPDYVGDFRLKKTYKYGKIRISVYTQEEAY